jgi:hypothetical protein
MKVNNIAVHALNSELTELTNNLSSINKILTDNPDSVVVEKDKLKRLIRKFYVLRKKLVQHQLGNGASLMQMTKSHKMPPCEVKAILNSILLKESDQR